MQCYYNAYTAKTPKYNNLIINIIRKSEYNELKMYIGYFFYYLSIVYYYLYYKLIAKYTFSNSSFLKKIILRIVLRY